MKHVGNIAYTEGAKHKKKRIGRGPGSGHGGTSTKGHKGQKSRAGASITPGFEGGQMPINRRLPKFGFFNRFRVEYQVVNVSTLARLAVEEKFENNIVNFESLYNSGAINNRRKPVKILGNGDIEVALEVQAHKFTKSAIEKIEKAGGKIILAENATKEEE